MCETEIIYFPIVEITFFLIVTNFIQKILFFSF